MSHVSIDRHSATIRGLKTAWCSAGTLGQPILFFCHGFPDSAETWNQQLQVLGQWFHVIAPDVRGCEDSQIASDLRRYGRDAILLDHLELLQKEQQGQEPVICVGHDLGVVHAMTLARHLGPRCAGVICLNGLDIEMFGRRLGSSSQMIKSWYMAFMQFPYLPELAAQFAPHASHWFTQTLGGGFYSLKKEGFERRTIGPLNQYRAFAREYLKTKDQTHRLRCPVLVLWGRDDGVLDPPTEEEWALVASHVEIRILPGGHWLHHENAEMVTKFIQDFVDHSLKGSRP